MLFETEVDELVDDELLAVVLLVVLVVVVEDVTIVETIGETTPAVIEPGLLDRPQDSPTSDQVLFWYEYSSRYGSSRVFTELPLPKTYQSMALTVASARVCEPETVILDVKVRNWICCKESFPDR